MSKRKRAMPKKVVLIWDGKETQRMSEAVEKLSRLVNDLETLLAEPKRRAEAAAATRKLRQQASEQAGARAAADLLNNGTEAAAPEAEPFIGG